MDCDYRSIPAASWGDRPVTKPLTTGGQRITNMRMLRNLSTKSFFAAIVLVLGFGFLPLAARAGEAGKAKEPVFSFLLTTLQTMDAGECRAKALDAERTGKGDDALSAWERVIDRCPATDEQRLEARAHIKDLRPKVPRNTDSAKAHPWKTLFVIFRTLDFSWTDAKGNKVAVKKTLGEADEKKIRGSIDAYCGHVFRYSSGMLRIDADIRILDAPLTNLHGKDQGPFEPSPHIVQPFLEPMLKDKAYDTVFAYVKYNGDTGPDVPAPYTAATFGSVAEFKGAGYVMVPWHTNYPYPGETDGEMEVHEWLHQIDSMFSDVLHYPGAIVQNPDTGRMEDDNRPNGDAEYARKKTETTWIGFYQHIMEDHITRQMWSEAAIRLPARQPAPGDVCKPRK